MAKHPTNTDNGSPRLLRRTVIKLSAAGLASGAVGGTASGDTTQEDAEAAITLPAQRTHGFEIEIEEATLPDGGFISLIDPVGPHEKLWPRVGETMPSETDVIDAQTIGTTEYLEPGTHEGVTLELEGPLDLEHNVDDYTDGKLYQVWMHQDTNGDETFADVAPGEPDNRYSIEGLPDPIVGDGYIEFAPFNPTALQDQIEENQAQIAEIEEQIEEEDDTDNQGQVSELEQERDELQNEVSDLEDQVAELKGNSSGDG